jgi:hypothetical protein
VAALSSDQAHLLGHLIIHLMADIQRFFPAMDRGYVLLAEQWHGLPEAVRRDTLRLYSKAVAQYETVHGLATLNFETLRMKSGAVQGCLLSTEKAKLFMNTLAEAVANQVDGIRFWDGTAGGGKRMPQAILADDVLGMLTSWRALERFVSILREWAKVTKSRFGVDGFTKTVYSAASHDADGAPCEAERPAGLDLRLDGENEVPRMPITVDYPHVGFRRRLDGQQEPQYAHLAKLNHAWLARVARVRKLSRREFAEYTNVGFEAVAGVYCCWLPVDLAIGERCGEKARRLAYKRRFRPLQPTHADYYLPGPWQRGGQLGEGVNSMVTASMVGEGWEHLTAIANATLYTSFANAIADGTDSPIRTAVRSAVDLSAYSLGMQGEGFDTWRCDHLTPVLGEPVLGRLGLSEARGAASKKHVESCGRRIAAEAFILQCVRMRRGVQRETEDAEAGGVDAPDHNFRFVHVPPTSDPMATDAAHHAWDTDDRLELWRGELTGGTIAEAVGHPRVPSRRLLAAGVKVRSHLCRRRGAPAYMTYAQGAALIPDLDPGDTAAERAWVQVVSDLELLDVPPVAGEATKSAAAIWWGAKHGWGEQHDGGARGGDHAWLDTLEARRADGEQVAVSDWADGYKRWMAEATPRAAVEPSETVLPTAAELHGGAHITYVMPPVDERKGGKRKKQKRAAAGSAEREAEDAASARPKIAAWGDRRTAGGPAPVPTASDVHLLQLYAAQRWRFSKDGRVLACELGSELADASVVVRLHAASIPIVTAAHEERLVAKERREAARRVAAYKKGEDPPEPIPPSVEERANYGGPGYCVQLAQSTMDAMLRAEQCQGYVWTLAAAGDGSWKPEEAGGYGSGLGRGSLLHDGRRLGGEMASEREPGPMQLYGGRRHNFDTELATRLDVLDEVATAAALGMRERLLYAFDATSPMEAAASFRARHTRARMQMECDEMQGAAMALEDEAAAVTNWWLKSHRGHLLSAAADEIADSHVIHGGTGEYVDVPHAPSRHRSARFYAKRSERDLAMAVACQEVGEQLIAVEQARRDQRNRAALIPALAHRPAPMRAERAEVDALRHASVDECVLRAVMELRWDRADLIHSAGSHPSDRADSMGRWLLGARCPCGAERQTRSHVLWECTMCADERRDLRDALLTASQLLGRLDPIEGHPSSYSCYRAVDSCVDWGGEPTRPDASVIEQQERHLLGLVRRPNRGGLSMIASMAAMGGVLRAAAAMLSTVRKGTRSVWRAVLRRRGAWQAQRAAMHRWLAVYEARGTRRAECSTPSGGRGAMGENEAAAGGGDDSVVAPRSRMDAMRGRAAARSAIRWWRARCAAAQCAAAQAEVAVHEAAAAAAARARATGRQANHQWGAPRWRREYRRQQARSGGVPGSEEPSEAAGVTWQHLRSITAAQLGQDHLLSAVRSARSASARRVRHRVWATATPRAMRAGAAAAATPVGAAAAAGGGTAAARTVDGRERGARPKGRGQRKEEQRVLPGSAAATLLSHRLTEAARREARRRPREADSVEQQRRVVRALFQDDGVSTPLGTSGSTL